ncbi:DUF4440 domain-containing protein [Nonomuraea sp. NPDC059194]|uniref:DUF4440 domain-containing protein n=1 Tax=Nonomuraea sp. NPDC059194 TaxID=3346764 RepID=UPI0036CA7820
MTINTPHPTPLRKGVSPVEATACQAEIVRHHETIEGWLNGRAPRSDLDVFASAHSSDFAYTSPDGRTLPMPDLMAMIESAHGAAPSLVIEIRDVEVVASADTVVVATYEERHYGPDPRNRRATVVFVRDADAPHGLRWRHLHETWIQHDTAPRPPGQTS